MSANIILAIEELSQFAQEGSDSRQLSIAVYLHGLPWKILAIPQELDGPPPGRKCLGYFLQCNADNTDPAWSCNASAIFKVLAHKEGKEDHVREITPHVFKANANKGGFAQFMSFEALMDSENGWYDEATDSIMLHIHVTADEPQGIKLPDVAYKQYTISSENALSVGIEDEENLTYNVRLEDKSWEFKYLPDIELLRIKMLMNSSSNGDKTIAELIFWFWKEKEIVLLQKGVHTFEPDSHRIVVSTNGSIPVNKKFHVVIRVLEQITGDSDSMESYYGDFEGIEKVTLCVVGPEEASFVIPKYALMYASPVFRRMFINEMTEKDTGKVEIKDTNPEEFGDFLKAISPKQEHPNPSNVLALLKLADRYDCQLLRNRCELHLMNCVELPLLELFTCADLYKLDKLKKHLRMNFIETGLFQMYQQSKPYLELLALFSKMDDEGI